MGRVLVPGFVLVTQFYGDEPSASAETEIFHELLVILVDHCGQVIGPMLVAFV